MRGVAFTPQCSSVHFLPLYRNHVHRNRVLLASLPGHNLQCGNDVSHLDGNQLLRLAALDVQSLVQLLPGVQQHRQREATVALLPLPRRGEGGNGRG